MASGSMVSFSSKERDAVFGRLAGHHEWVNDSSRLEPLRVDRFSLEFSGNTEPSRLLKGISNGMAKRIARETENLYAIATEQDAVSVYERNPPKLMVAAINLGLSEKADLLSSRGSKVTVELKNLGSEETNSRIYDIILDIMLSIQKMNNVELEHFLDSGEMVSLKR